MRIIKIAGSTLETNLEYELGQRDLSMTFNRSVNNSVSDNWKLSSKQAILVIRAFPCPLLFHYHGEHQYPIRGHGRSCCAGPMSCARSFTDSPNHFDYGDCKSRPLMVNHSENPRAFIRSRFYAFLMYAVISRNATPAYNESHLYIPVPMLGNGGLMHRAIYFLCIRLSLGGETA
jgi:hypothetical protein